MTSESATITTGERQDAAPRLVDQMRRHLAKPVLLLVPALVLLGVFFLYPVGTIIARTFTETLPGDGALSNLSWFFNDPTQVTILVRTFTTALITTAVCLLVGYPYAYLITVVSTRWRAVLLGLVVISAWQSILVRNYAWRILERDSGLINDVLQFFGAGPVHLLGTTTGVIIGMAHVMAPFMILPLYATLRTIDRRLLLAARSLGAPSHSAFAHVYFPLSLPGVAAGSLLVFVISLGFFITPAMLGSPGNSLISQAIVLQINRLLDWGHAGAMAFVLLVCTLALLGLGAWAARRRLAAVAGGGSGR